MVVVDGIHGWWVLVAVGNSIFFSLVISGGEIVSGLGLIIDGAGG